LVGAAGVGLFGSGVFETDPVGGFPPQSTDVDSSDTIAPKRPTQTLPGTLHNLFAIPIFAGIPLAGVLSAVSFAKRREYRWASYSAGSSILMVASFLLFGAAFAEKPKLAGKGGVFQRLSIVTGFGWMSVLSLRASTAS
jgi:hypothetical protein